MAVTIQILNIIQSFQLALCCKLELARLPILLRIQDRDRLEKNYIGGDTAQKKRILGGRDTAHTLLMRVAHGVGTPHNIEKWEGGYRTYFVDGRNNLGWDTRPGKSGES